MRARDEKEIAWDELYQFSGEPESPARSPRRNSRALLTFVLLMIGSTFFLKGTLAANISLGSSNFEFGQGVQVLTACSGATPLTVTPIAAFANASGAGSFYFKSFKISNIPAECAGKSFTLNAYDSATATALPTFDTTTSDVVIYNDSGNYVSASGTTVTLVTHSTSSFTATFTSPAALASQVARITLQSTKGTPPYDYNSVAFTPSTYLTLSPGISPGTSPFSIEAWIKTDSSFNGGNILGNANESGGLSFILDSPTLAHIDGYNIGAYNYTLPFTLQPNTWYHIAIARNGSNAQTVWVNGTRSTTGVQTDSINYYGKATGINWAHCTWCVAGSSKFNGERISNLRVIVGSTPYDPNSATITVPTMPLANVTNTKLLLNFNNSSSMLVDSSGTQTVTNNGVTFQSGQ
ncbi:MAG: hypothetical protein F2602_00955 [Actinobacteria bacterium]|uniref:Unannotated protein n=1 Tax=freshwater metagenome TaxID=449393 RepID=A0A6J6I1M8_9ZZZZ|nr:hypothetical protein [Actinomycetota bacterium]